MATLIQELGQWLSQSPLLQVQYDQAALLVRIPVNDRAQTVKVSTHQARDRSHHFIRLQSRACVAKDHRIVRDALRMNAGLEWGGLVLDTSVQPPVLDVTYNIVAKGLEQEYFIQALHRIAFLADHVEHITGSGDHF